MSKNFSDFKFEAKTHEFEAKTSKPESKTNQNDLRKNYDELSRLDNDSLSRRLASEVAKRKQEGSFDANMLLSSVESVRAFLPPETYQNLKNLIENLK